MALMAPVRLRATASGLMIEKVRSIAIVGVPLGLVVMVRNTVRAVVGALIAAGPSSGKVRGRIGQSSRTGPKRA
jgi:hypothetical protein